MIILQQHLALLALLVVLLENSVNAFDRNSSFYTGWEIPEYCSDLNQMPNKIEPLSPSQLESNPSIKLVQVQVLARHGARVPYYRVFCWDKAPSPVNSRWDCGPTMVSSQDINNHGRLYQKSYDVEQNVLTGTCMVGALLPLGRSQHLINGRTLRNAYSQKLFGNSLQLSSLVSQNKVYFRTDDEERTLGSGHALVDGMFPPELDTSNNVIMPTWHTCDIANDIINVNKKSCPILYTIDNEYGVSEDLRQYESQPSVVKTQKDFESVVGKISWDTTMECLMIARCNEIALPEKFTPELFDRVISQAQERVYLANTFNNSRGAKISMAPLMASFISRMKDAILLNDTSAQLAVVMGHDSTLQPLLAAMLGRDAWDGKWPPFAAMMVMELYQLREDKDFKSYAVRVVYQGKPLHIPGCADTICTFPEFLAAMEFGTSPRECAAVPVAVPVTTTTGSWSNSVIVLSLAIMLIAILFKLYKSKTTDASQQQHEETSSLL